MAKESCAKISSFLLTYYPNVIVYEALITSQYYILGFNIGISLYDRYTDLWAEFQLDTAITSLTVYRGCLLGVTLGDDWSTIDFTFNDYRMSGDGYYLVV